MADLVFGFTADAKKAEIAVAALAKAVIDFAKDSVRAFAEQEKADAKLSGALRQLGYDAKALTPIFKAQADAFQNSLGVQGEMVQQMQSLMLTFGAAPKDIERTTQAILDYAALTGDDAVSATRLLLREVQAGDGSIKKLGISYDSTGSKTQDLARLTDELAQKFGGAAAQQANTLAGRMERVGNQVSEVKESFGAFLAMVADKTGALEGLANAATRARIALAGAEGAEDIKFQIKQLEGLADASMSAAKAASKARGAQTGSSLIDYLLYGNLNTEETEQKFVQRAAELRKKADELRAQLEKDAVAAAAALPAVGTGGDDRTDVSKKGDQKAADDAAKLRTESLNAAFEAIDAELAAEKELTDQLAAENQKRLANAFENIDAQLKLERDAAEQRKLTIRAQRMAVIAADDEDMKSASEAGMGIGSAIAIAMASEVAAGLATGQAIELDFLAAQIIVALAQAAMMLTPAAPFAPVVGIIGNAAIMAAKAERYKSKFASKMRHHDGGIVEPLEFHDGGEVPAILQTGEVVWSRSDVARYGGPSSVDRMRQGGGQTVHVHIATQDATGLREFYQGNGGRAFKAAVRTGQGPLAAMMRRGR